jgi:transposase
MRRLEMSKVKEILKLKHEVGLTLREIANACGCGKSTVAEILTKAEEVGIEWPSDLTEIQLMQRLYPPAEGKKSQYEPDVEYIFQEMKKENVTLTLLWEEYKRQYPEGLMYTQFCERYRRFKKENKIVMRKEHKAGNEVETDWAGSTITYVDRNIGEVKEAYIFVAVLPASAYPFAYAYGDMKSHSWIDAHIRAYIHFEGVPRFTIPDCTKTAVIKTDLYDPVLNKSYYDMAEHFNTIIMPARSYKPKDKSAVENAVQNVERRIIAALRNRRFFSINDINEAIVEELENLSNRPFQKIEGTRLTAFENTDKPCLQPLPLQKYEYAEFKETKVHFNYHIEWEGFFYSVNYTYVGQACMVRATISTIEVFINNERVCAHARNYNKFKRYKTLPEHMPEAHKTVSGWSDERFIKWAGKIGSNTVAFIQQVLDSREHSVQSYRSCMGIMRIAKKYSEEVIEEACKKAIDTNVSTYKYFEMIVKQISQSMNAQPSVTPPKRCGNIRGREACEGGGVIV